MYVTLWLVLAFHLVSVISENPEGPKVETTRGWIQGDFSVTKGGRKVFQFLGIKYAKEPTGVLRFKDPVPPERWTDVRPATHQCEPCMQNMVIMEALRDIVLGSEDCLCLNVFSPELSPAKMPVIVFIHGGAFQGMSCDRAFYGPELLLDKDVVLVTLNYRLGVLGFLSTEDSVIPGNWGMKDQVAALRWVKDNIDKFGGDPGSVTLMGESAGATSVHLHMMSPLSQKFFHRGIAHSGSGVVPWGCAKPGVLLARATELAKQLQYSFTDSSAFLSHLQGLDAKDIVATTKNFLVWDIDPSVIWLPTVEPDSVEGAFLVEQPRKLKSSLPFLTGFNFAEGAIKTLSMTSGKVSEKFDQWNNDFKKLTAMTLEVDPNIVDEIRTFYFGSVDKITPEMSTQINQLFGDLMFANGVLDAVELHQGTKFLYFFNYNNTHHFSLLSKMMNNDLYLGTCHFEELPYLFPMGEAHKLMDPELSSKIVEMWTNFAKDSNPSIDGLKWNPVETPSMEYLEISNNYLGMKSNPLEKRRDFYKSLSPYA